MKCAKCKHNVRGHWITICLDCWTKISLVLNKMPIIICKTCGSDEAGIDEESGGFKCGNCGKVK